ncbi:MAG TPA: M56 family metallopeptidase [Xanthobacteraceae bacterium]|nr:M56 family metallopeptidase [Xanthobacteraceae bacterium]
MTTNEELLFYLVRTTLALAVAVLLTGSLLRLTRVTSPVVHRVGCILALAVGWSFLQWPVRVPWYEPPAAAAPDDMASSAADPEPVSFAASGAGRSGSLMEVDAPLALVEEPPATIELPHIDLSQPLAVAEQPAESTSETPLADTPPVISAPIELATELPDLQAAEPPIDLPIGPSMQLPDESVASVPVETDVSTSEAPTPTAAWEFRDFAPYAGAAWGGGIGLLVLAWLAGYARFVRRLPTGRMASIEWLDEWQTLLTDHGITRTVPLRVTADMGPMLCRLPRGYELLVPGPLWQELNATERAAILRHELAHLERGDVWKSLAARVLALPHWFNPFSWWAVRRFDEAAEWACDRAASAEHATTTYARALVRLGEVAGRHASYSPAARGRPLAARIRRLLAGRLREDSSAKKALLLAACTGFALAALVRVELVAREATQQPKTASSDSESLATADDASPRDAVPTNVVENGQPPNDDAVIGPVLANQEAPPVVQSASDPAPAGRGDGAPEGAEVKRTPRNPEVLRSTIEGYKAAMASYESGRGAKLTSVCDWSLRMLLAEDSLEFEVQRSRKTPRGNVFVTAIEPTTIEARAAAAQAHLQRMKELQKKVADLQKAGERGGEPEDKALIEYYVADAERRVSWIAEEQAAAKIRHAAGGESQQPLSAAKPDQPAPAPATPRYPEVIAAARAGFEAALQEFDRDMITLDCVCAWSVRWLHAEASSELVVENAADAEIPGGPGEPNLRHPNNEERIAFVRAHLARMKELQARILALYKVGARGGEVEKKAMMDYFVAEAERDLKRLQSHQARQQRAKAALASVKREGATEAQSSGAVKQDLRFFVGDTKPTTMPRKPGEPPPDSGRDRLRYDNRSFTDWLAQVDTELSLGRRKESIAALTAFGQRGFGPEVAKKLIELLRDEDLREYAIRGLGRLGPTASEAIPALEEAAKEDRYRQDALEALALVRGEKIDVSRPAENAEARAERQRREAKLRELLTQKSDELARDMQDIQRLHKSLGITQSADAPAQVQMLEQQLVTVNKSFLDHTAQLENLDVEIDKYKRGLALLNDPTAREAHAEEEMRKDEKLRKLEEQRNDLELAVGEAKNQIKSNDNPTLKRLQKSMGVVEENIEIRRDELRMRFADSNGATKLKEHEGKLRATEEQRDAVSQQLKDMDQKRAELTAKLKVVTRDAAELDLKEHKVKLLHQLIEELKRDLQKLPAQKQSSQAGAAKPDTTAAAPPAQPSPAKPDSQDAPANPEAKLREQLAAKNGELARAMQELDIMAAQLEKLQRASAALNEKILEHTQLLNRLDQEIEQYEVENKQKPIRASVWLLGQSELAKDEKLQKLVEQKQEIERAIGSAKEQGNTGDDATVDRLKESLASTEEKITVRQEEIIQRASESDPFGDVRKEALLKSARERRENIAASLEQWKKEREQLAEQLLPLTDDSGKFAAQRRAVQELQQVVDELNRDLQQATEAASQVERLEPAVVSRDGRAVAYVKILRDPETMTTRPRERQGDSHDFLTRRNTTLEMMRSKALLTRVTRQQKIAELPIVQKQADPARWLRDNLQLHYPNDAELLEIALQGGDLEQLKQIVNAIVDVYFEEVVEKAVKERANKEAKLKELHGVKTAEMERQRERLQSLEKLTTQHDADLKKIAAEKASPPRIERVPEPPPVATIAPQPAPQPAAPIAPAAPAQPAATPEIAPKAAAQPVLENAPPDEAKLRQELMAKNDELIRAMHDVVALQRRLGIVDTDANGGQQEVLQRRLGTLNNQLRSLNSACLTLDTDIGRLNEELKVIESEQGKKERAERILQSDGILSFYKNELAMRTELNKRKASIDDKGLDTLDTDKRIKSRREELLAASAARDAAKAKEVRGKLAVKHRERDRVKEQLAALEREIADFFARLESVSQGHVELAQTRQRVKALQTIVDELNTRLYKVSVAKQAAAEQQAAAEAVNDPQKAAAARQKKKDKLQDLLRQKSEELERDMADADRLRKVLGVASPSEVGKQTSAYQESRARLDGDIFDATAQIARMEGELDKLRLEIELAGDPAVQKGRPWEAMQYDLELKSLEQQLQDLGAATAAVAQMPDSEHRVVENLRMASRLENLINRRRSEFVARYADGEAAATLGELRAKLVATEKQRDSARQYLGTLKKMREEGTQQLQVSRRDAAELENKEQKIKGLTHLIDELTADLQKLDAAGPAAAAAP